MLQLVYHAPPTLSRRAAGLLRAFRSTAILPELQEIVLDEQYEHLTRIYALSAFAAAPGDVLAEAFQPLAQAAILRREHWMKHSRQQDMPMDDWFDPDLLHDLGDLANRHPSNREWFFSILDAADPYVQKTFLESRLDCEMTDSYRVLLVKRLLNLLDTYPQFLDIDVVLKLVHAGSEAETWLDSHFDAIARLCLEAPDSTSVKSAAFWWPRLDRYLHQSLDQWEMTSDRPKGSAKSRSEEPSGYLNSPAYRYLMERFERARRGERDAFHSLERLARFQEGKNYIAMRAVATHLIGKLKAQFDVFPVLAWLMRHGAVVWENEVFNSPIRHEAGEALLSMPSPAAWEVLIDAYFIDPCNELSDFQDEWIEHVTAVLSGDTKPYMGLRYGEESRRPWFRRLSKITEEEIAAIKA